MSCITMDPSTMVVEGGFGGLGETSNGIGLGMTRNEDAAEGNPHEPVLPQRRGIFWVLIVKEQRRDARRNQRTQDERQDK